LGEKEKMKEMKKTSAYETYSKTRFNLTCHTFRPSSEKPEGIDKGRLGRGYKAERT